MRHLRLLGAAAMLAVAAYFLAVALVRPGEARAEIFGSNGGQGGDVSSITTGILPQARGGTGAGALTCASGQVLTSNGSAYSCTPAFDGSTLSNRRVGQYLHLYGNNSDPAFGTDLLGLQVGQWNISGRSSNGLIFYPATQGAGSQEVAGFSYNNVTSSSWGTMAGRPVYGGVFATDAALTQYKLINVLTSATTVGGSPDFRGSTIPNATPAAASSRYIGFAYDVGRSGNWWICSGDGSNNSCQDTGVAVVASTLYAFTLDASTLVDGGGFTVSLSSKTIGSSSAFASLGTWTRTTNVSATAWQYGHDFYVTNTAAVIKKLGVVQFALSQNAH